jgi:hypothetical protein
MRTAITICILGLVLSFGSYAQQAQTTEFTYQGKLTDQGASATGTYQMEFGLFDAAVDGNQIGSTISNSAVSVAQGMFTVRLDFGAAAFVGPDRFLQVSVRRSAGDPFITLLPRHKIGSTPYATKSKAADEAGNAAMLNGQPASEYVTNTSLDASVIRNQSTEQTNANFHISGNGVFGGNVGIGTASPQTKLSVLTNGHGITQTDGTITVGTYVSSLGGWLGTRSNHPLHFFANNSAPYMTVATNGFVGIGTWSPNAGLELKGSGPMTQQRITDNFSGNSLVLQGGTDANMKVTGYNYPGGFPVPLYISVDGANTILNSGGGNVGIGLGNTFPQALLHVRANTTGHGALFENASGRAAFFNGGVTATGPSTFGQTLFEGDVTISAGFFGSRNLNVSGTGSFNNVVTLFPTGGTFNVCSQNSGRLSLCSSSLRYKSDVRDLSAGMEIVRKLRPITFTWKSDQKRDVGFAAEEVAALDPLLATYNQSGEIEGVKYAQLSALFVNAFKEQQAQIEAQQRQIDQLKALVCALLGEGHEACARK